jgi:gliding motility-associated-like protein
MQNTMLFKLNWIVRSLLILLFFIAWRGVFGQPPNDDCVTAQYLCMNETTMGTTAGASPGNDICFTANATVWFSFITNDIGGNVNVVVDRDSLCNSSGTTGNGLQGVVFTADSPCDVASMTPVSNCLEGEYGFVLSAPGLLPETEYWIQIDGILNGLGTPTSCDFEITVSGPGVNVNAGPDKTIVAGQTVTLEGSGATTYSWNPTNSLNNPTSATPLASPAVTTTYTLTGTRDGCTSSDNVTVFIQAPIEAPNAFTPNGDGYNDLWEIAGINRFPNAIVEIYSRWGQRIFSSVGYISPWNGTHDGSYIPEGTYYWVIQLNDESLSSEEPITGYVAIIR